MECTKNMFKPGLEPPEKIKFRTGFTVANLEMIAGIKVVWTSNLAEQRYRPELTASHAPRKGTPPSLAQKCTRAKMKAVEA